MSRLRMVVLGGVVLMMVGCGGDGGGTADASLPAPDATIDNLDAAGPTVVEINTTEGTIVVELFPQYMPITTANFLRYVDDGWYDGTLIHRVIDDWVIQGGGYTTGLSPKTPYAPIQLETSPMVSHVHGAISMARTNDPDSATSQWFIVDSPETGTPPQPAQLDGQYAAFGVMIEDDRVLANITQRPTQSTGGLDDVPVTEIVVTSITRR